MTALRRFGVEADGAKTGREVARSTGPNLDGAQAYARAAGPSGEGPHQILVRRNGGGKAGVEMKQGG